MIEPRGVYISTYGCQMNVSDSERMYALLEMENYVQVPSPEEASLIIINSCSVREKPVHKVRSEVGHYRELKAKNSELLIGVGGCVGQQEKDALFKTMPILDFVFGPDNIDSLPQLMGEAQMKRGRRSIARFEHGKPYHIETLVRNPGVSTFVNITKGCDNFCTFCVVPFTRGRLRSRPLKDIVQDIQKLVAKGTKEVTLLGQNVNSYESECDASFSQLLKAIAEDTDILRIRYTTSHPKDFNQDLVDVMSQYRQKICDYVHLPVQSGNSEILARMNRGYTREMYLDKIKMIQETLPGAAFSTDIIVGFPGETEAQFDDTLSLIDAVPFENIYAFSYSARPFTKAIRYEEQMTESQKNERLIRLQNFHKPRAFELASRYIGQSVEILVEDVSRDTPDRMVGRTSTNKLIGFNGSKDLIGSCVTVKITESTPHGSRGEVIN